MSVVLGWSRAGRIWLVHLAPPCASFSTAPDKKKRERLKESGMTTARCMMIILRVCVRHNVKWTSDYPQPSRICTWPPLLRFLHKHDCYVVFVDYCMYGMHYKKPTILATDSFESCSLGRVREGGHYHDILAGTVRLESGSRWVTSLASAYPVKLAHAYAKVAARAAPASAHRRHGDGVPPGCSALRTTALRRAVGAEPCSLFELAPRCARTEGRRWSASAPRWDDRRSFAAPRSPRRDQMWDTARRTWQTTT